MHHLHQAVHACVGSASAVDANTLRTELNKRQLQLILNGVAGELALPALISSAVVADA